MGPVAAAVAAAGAAAEVSAHAQGPDWDRGNLLQVRVADHRAFADQAAPACQAVGEAAADLDARH